MSPENFPSLAGGSEAVDDGRRSVDGGRRSFDGGRRSFDGGRRSVDGRRLSVDGGPCPLEELPPDMLFLGTGGVLGAFFNDLYPGLDMLARLVMK